MAVETPDETSDTLKLELRRPVFWSGRLRGWLVLCAIAAALVLMGSERDPRRTLMVMAGLAVLALALILGRLVLRPRRVPPVEVAQTRLVLPLDTDASRTAEVRYADLQGVSVHLRGREEVLVIEAPGRAFAFPASSFVVPNAIEIFLGALRARLVGAPGGVDVLVRMAQRDDVMRNVLAQRPTVTYALLIAIAVGFLVQIVTGAVENALSMVRLGANVPALVWQGEWYRLVTANFLHGGFLHIYLNGLALLTLGAVLERIIGPWRLLLVYLTAAVGGAFTSALAERAPLSIGASTAVFGLLGALAVVNWRYRRDLPLGFRQSLRWWVFVLGINAALPLLVPQIDVAAHLGGFVAGVVVSGVLVGSRRRLVYRMPPSLLLKAVVAALVAVYGVALGLTAEQALDQSREAQVRRLGGLLGRDGVNAESLNEVAWLIAISPRAQRAELEGAAEMAERALELQPQTPAFLDTLATVRYRLGDLDDAIRLESLALLRQDDDAMFASQLARFLRARMRGAGPLEQGPLEKGAARLRWTPGKPGQEPQLVIELDGPAPHGLMLYAVASERGRAVGLVRVVLGGRTAEQRRSVFADSLAEAELGEDVRLELAWVDSRGCGCAPQEESVKVWSHVPDVDRLP